jgi:hypothetical protein
MTKRKRLNPARPKLIRGQPLHSGYPGVTYERALDRSHRPWKAYVIRDGKHFTVGRFADEMTAATAAATERLKV